MRVISNKVIEIPFLEREEEEAIYNELVKKRASSVQLMLIGKSGTGKTSLIKNTLNRVYRFNPEAVIIYTDLNHDDFTNNLFLELLIGSVFIERSFNINDAIHVSNALCFKAFLEKKGLKKFVKHNLYSSLVDTLSFIPSIGTYLEKIIPKKLIDSDSDQRRVDPDFRLLFLEYLSFITSKTQVYIILDNYQFLSNSLRSKFESSIKIVPNNLSLVNIIRTKEVDNEYSIYQKFRIFEDAQAILLSAFNTDQIEVLLKSCFPDTNQATVDFWIDDCYNVTQGNLKEIEQYIFSIRNKQLGFGKTTNPMGSLIDNRVTELDKIQTDILILASLFPNGLKINYIKDILDRNYVFKSESDFKNHVELLIKYNFIYLNGSNADLLKPAHEKIINAVRNNLDEDNLLEIRKSCIETFKSVIESSKNQREYAHLISNLVGILKSHELKKHIKYFIQLVSILHQTCNFHQILAIYENVILEGVEGSEFSILKYLPDYVLVYLLETFQKTSNFELGLSITKHLKVELKDSSEIDFSFYQAKYLTQLYLYKQAFEIIDRQKRDNLKYLYLKLNIMQHLRQDDEVSHLINVILDDNPDYENEYFNIILRNTGHLFENTKAKKNLMRAGKYFRDGGNIFGEATCHNNLGLVFLYSRDFPSAKKYFERAERVLSSIMSNEIYQPKFNLGLLNLIEGNYSQALDYKNEALINLPSSLEFDRIKFMSNIHICEFMEQVCNAEDLVKIYQEYLMSARRLPDPWLRFMLKYNLGAIMLLIGKEKEGRNVQAMALKEYPGNSKIYGVKHALLFQGKTYEVLLSTSPHWRY